MATFAYQLLRHNLRDSHRWATHICAKAVYLFPIHHYPGGRPYTVPIRLRGKTSHYLTSRTEDEENADCSAVQTYAHITIFVLSDPPLSLNRMCLFDDELRRNNGRQSPVGRLEPGITSIEAPAS